MDAVPSAFTRSFTTTFPAHAAFAPPATAAESAAAANATEPAAATKPTSTSPTAAPHAARARAAAAAAAAFAAATTCAAATYLSSRAPRSRCHGPPCARLTLRCHRVHPPLPELLLQAETKRAHPVREPRQARSGVASEVRRARSAACTAALAVST